MCGDTKVWFGIVSHLSEKKKTYILFCLTVFPTFLQKKGTNNDDVVLNQEKEGANSCSNFELTASKLLTT